MTTIVFFLEEDSAKAFLESLIPRLFQDQAEFKYITFEGKQDLEKKLYSKLKNWCVINTKFVILRDKDSGNCFQIKERLLEICRNAGKSDTLVRIACYELESWYLGDLKSVGITYQIPSLVSLQGKKKYRNPDDYPNPSKTLLSITKNKYLKVSGSRKIGHIISMDNNKSHSFNVFIRGLKNLVMND